MKRTYFMMLLLAVFATSASAQILLDPALKTGSVAKEFTFVYNSGSSYGWNTSPASTTYRGSTHFSSDKQHQFNNTLTGQTTSFSPPPLSNSMVWVGGISSSTTTTNRSSTFFNPYHFAYSLIRSVTGDHTHGVFEFDIAGLPTSAMTTHNWTARLNSINTTGSGSGDMSIELFDLNDLREDAAISHQDYAAIAGRAIAQRSYSAPGGLNAPLTDIDVTAQLRRDLFGLGAGDSTTGFILIPVLSGTGNNGRVAFDGNAANIVITVNESSGMQFVPEVSTKTVAAGGTTVTHEHYLVNTGHTAETYDLTADVILGWTAAVTPSQVTLDAGGMELVTVEVTVPAGAQDGATEVATVTAASTTNATHEAQVVDTTTVDSRPPQPDVWIRNVGDTAWTGDDDYDAANQYVFQSATSADAAIYEITIENDDNAEDTVVITGTAGDASWTVSYYDAFIGGSDITAEVTGAGWGSAALASGATAEIRAEVLPDVSVAEGELFTATVVATSEGDASAHDGASGESTAMAVVAELFADDFESGDTSAWSGTVE